MAGLGFNREGVLVGVVFDAAREGGTDFLWDGDRVALVDLDGVFVLRLDARAGDAFRTFPFV
jgi:hypothetical protein